MKPIIALFIILSSTISVNSQKNSSLKFFSFQDDQTGDYGLMDLNGKRYYIGNGPNRYISYYSTDGFIKDNGTIYHIKEISTAFRPQCEWVGEFKDGYAPAKINKDTFGLINEKGKTILKIAKWLKGGIQVDKLLNYSEGLISFKDDEGHIGFFNRKGILIVPPKYSYAKSFQEGFCVVAYELENTSPSFDEESRNYTLIDTNGIELFKPFVTDLFTNYSNGLRSVKISDYLAVLNKKSDTVFKINTSHGHEYYISDFLDGYATFRENGLFGLINSSGKIIIEPKYPYLRYGDGMILFAKSKEDPGWDLQLFFGFLNLKEEEIIPAIYFKAVPFTGEFTLVQKGNGRCFIIDKKGILQNIIPFRLVDDSFFYTIYGIE